MRLRGLLVALFLTVIGGTAAPQAPAAAPQLIAVTHTAYSKNTELFAEWRPLIVGQVITVLSTAVVRDGAMSYVYVQRTPERFEFREVTTRRTIGNATEITTGLRDGERIVVRGAETMPRE